MTGPSVATIRDRIVTLRRERVVAEGHALGAPVPAERAVPLVPFLRDPPLICEIKRRSPSRGAIDSGLNPVDLAGTYREHGVRSLSVLTEEDHFAGSLGDLMAVKQAYPDLALLRKDFLLDREDVEVSYRAGADAVLLIASVLSAEELAALHARAAELGMAALVELHDPADFANAAPIAPPLLGINARDLTTFTVDLLTPVRLRHQVTWKHRAVFESGVFTEEDAELVAVSGFDGLLVGEAAVRDQTAIDGILAGLTGGRGAQAAVPGGHRETGRHEDPGRAAPRAAAPHDAGPGGHPGAGTRPGFWSRLAGLMRDDRPLAKVCGITNRADAELAAELGADLLGFVFAESPRRASPVVVRELADLPVLKVAVVVTGGAHGPLSAEVRQLLQDGLLDAVQYHGDESPQECRGEAFPYYKAVRLGAPEDAARMRAYGCPRVLVDARDRSAYGGTGKRLAAELVDAAAAEGPLWLAGGLSDENIASIASAYRPELVDVSSGLEAEPGRKDPERMKRFFTELTYG